MRIGPVHLLALALLLPLAARGHGVQTVTNTDDAGPGSLRQALLDADAGSVVEFAIPGAGLHTITPASPLPSVQAGVTIDGTTQPGASCAAWPPTLLVEVSGDVQGSGNVLTVAGDDVAIRGLVVNKGPVNGIGVGAVANFALTCSFVGSDATGSQADGNAADGVLLLGSTGAHVGGSAPTDRNLVSANGQAGIELSATASGNQILGNVVGATIAGTAALPNGNGIVVKGPGNQIGGAGVFEGNLISGNTVNGVTLEGASAADDVVVGNTIGLDALGFELDNGGAGVAILLGAHDNTIGDPAVAGNEIHANGGGAVVVSEAASLGNSIRGNSMGLNGSNGIDLVGQLGADANDPGDGDSGPNRLQNTPVLAAGSYAAATSTVRVTFSVDTDPANATYPLTVDVYRADADDQEGEIYLGSASYSGADFATGEVTRTFVAQGPVNVGQTVVATATDAAGNTSEFSAAAITLTAPEPAAAAAGLVAIAALARRRAPMRAAQSSAGRAPTSTDAT